MAELSIQLFGKFTIQADGKRLGGIDSRKVQELLAYLLVYRDRPHPRESLAELLWAASSTTQSKKYLRTPTATGQDLQSDKFASPGKTRAEIGEDLILAFAGALVWITKGLMPLTGIGLSDLRALSDLVSSSSGASHRDLACFSWGVVGQQH